MSESPPPLLSVIVPCYNERATVAELLRRVKAVPIEKEIIVIDDKSTDGSKDVVAALAQQWPEIRHRVFRREVIQSIKLRSNRFGFEPEVTAKVARRGYRIYEVPISYYGRDYWEGKKINWKDGVSAIWTILKYGLFDDPSSEPATYTT